jgi:hypothetical protein
MKEWLLVLKAADILAGEPSSRLDPAIPNPWSTPLVRESGDSATSQVILSIQDFPIGAADPKGPELWVIESR